MNACIDGRLNEHLPAWSTGACATVVLASPGYPGSYPKGLEITGLSEKSDGVTAFHAGTAWHGDDIVTAGGRVLAISGLGASLPEALKRAYAGVGQIHFDGMHYRRDIGRLYEGATR
jgi:phosphoribosylamine--glycine ligase